MAAKSSIATNLVGRRVVVPYVMIGDTPTQNEKFEIVAAFVRVDEVVVTLKKEDGANQGRMVTLPASWVTLVSE